MINSIKGFTLSRIGTQVMSNADRPLTNDGNVDWEAFDRMREDFPICVDHEADMISFKMMTKPESEGGSGAQLTDLIEVALHQLKYFNSKFPCKENACTITHLEEALMWQRERTYNRVVRGVEGKNEN